MAKRGMQSDDPPASTSNAAGSNSMMEQLSEYEIRRLQIMARNRQRLAELGLEKAVADLAELRPERMPHAPRKRQDRVPEPSGPARRSSRLQALQEGGHQQQPVDPLEQREPPPKRKRTAPSKTPRGEAEKMSELELSGLVDVTQEHAKFVVLGSTGKHYTVTLEDERQACECADYRFRRHHCKHLRLVLQQLGIPDSPEEWHRAVAKQVAAGGAAA